MPALPVRKHRPHRPACR